MNQNKKRITFTEIIVGLSLIIIFLEVFLRLIHFFRKDYKDSRYKPIFFSTFGTYQKQRLIFSEYAKVKFDYVPFLLWRSSPNQKTLVYSTNRDGFRGKEWNNELQKTIRIFFTGGSAAWGYGASSDNTTIESYLEKDLQEELEKIRPGLKVQVINAAEIGYISTQEFLLWQEFIKQKPDLIIHYDGFNDLYVGLLNRKAGWSHPFILEEIFTKNRVTAIAGIAINGVKEYFQTNWAIIDKFLDDSYLYRSLKFHLGLYRISPKNREYTDFNEIRNVYLQNIRLISDLSQKEKIPTLIILQPTLLVGNKPKSKEEEALMANFLQLFPKADEYYKKGYDLFRKALEDLEIDQSIFFDDGTSYFDGVQDDLYFHPVHYSDAGNAIVAQKILTVIKRTNLLSKIMKETTLSRSSDL